MTDNRKDTGSVGDDPRLAGGAGYLVVAITVLAALIRFYMLGEWSFWNDESHTVDVAIRGVRSDEVGQSLYYPVNFLLTNLSFRLFGVSELSARLFPCLFGILTVPATYWLGKAVSGRKTGLAAAFFLALSTWHIDWSQNARYYAMVGFLVTMAAILLIEGFERGRKAYLALAHVLLFASLMSHPSSAFAIVAFVVYLMVLLVVRLDKPDHFKGNLAFFLAPYFVAMIVFLPWYIKLPRMLLDLRGPMTSPLYVMTNVAYHIGPLIIVLSVASLAIRLSARNRQGVFLLCYTFIPLLLLMVASLRTVAYGAYVFYTLPAFCILAAEALVGIFDLSGKSKRVLAYAVFAAVTASLMSGTYLYFVHENGNRAMWKEACASVKKNLESGDVVFATEGATASFYMGSSATIYWLSQFEDRYGAVRDKTIWLIVYKEGMVRGSTRSFLRDRCRLVGEFAVNSSAMIRDIKIFKYVPQFDGQPAPEATGRGPARFT